MTEDEYLKEVDRLSAARTSAETEAYRMQNLYRHALRVVDSVKEQRRQLDQAWVNQEQKAPPDPNEMHVTLEIG